MGLNYTAANWLATEIRAEFISIEMGKAAGRRSPGRYREGWSEGVFRQVLKCGGPPPLWKPLYAEKFRLPFIGPSSVTIQRVLLDWPGAY
jgi:hypothetical protein